MRCGESNTFGPTLAKSISFRDGVAHHFRGKRIIVVVWQLAFIDGITAERPHQTRRRPHDGAENYLDYVLSQ
jgi:hypothetical protein